MRRTARGRTSSSSPTAPSARSTWLVVARKGLFLVEIKSWPGRIERDAGTWQWTPPDADEPRLRDNLYVLANRKAKRLKGLLAWQRAMRGKRVPYVAPLIFLSDPTLRASLDPEARFGVAGRDATDGEDQARPGGLPGVVATLTKLTGEERERLGERVIDRPMAKLIATALEQAGVRPSQRRRQVGDLELPELLDEGTGYQDHVGVHPRFPNVQHRVRIYGTSYLTTDEQREQFVRAARRSTNLSLRPRATGRAVCSSISWLDADEAASEQARRLIAATTEVDGGTLDQLGLGGIRDSARTTCPPAPRRCGVGRGTSSWFRGPTRGPIRPEPRGGSGGL